MTPTYKAVYSQSFPANLLLDMLMNEVEWLQMTEARKEYFMSDTPLKYVYGSGKSADRVYESKGFHPLVKGIMLELNSHGTNYNVCFLNRYDDQRNHLGWHADDSPEMDMNHPIGVLSFGAEREIWWKQKDVKGPIPNSNKQLLQNGSLFVMPAGFQKDHVHKIPKADHAVGPRVSLTFRRYVSA